MKNRNDDLILQFWSNLSASLPLRLTLPIGPGGSQLDFTVCTATVFVLGCMNACVQYFLVNHVGFPHCKQQKTMAGSIVGIFHSTIIITGMTYLFLSRKYVPCEKMSAAPLWWQDSCHALLQFISGYMVYDFTAFFVNGNVDAEDYPFLAHHAIVFLMLTSSRVVGAGHFAMVMLIWLGEITNPFMNCHYITTTTLTFDCCKDIEWVHTLDYINTFLFCVSYIPVRTIIGWYWFVHISYHLFKYGRENGIPLWLTLTWEILKWTVGFSSYLWVQDCAVMLHEKYFSEQAQVSAPDL